MSEVVTATRGRPRSETARKAVLAAAAELLLDRGLPGVSMDAVAERARVSKATIYRWWPTKETLALDMLFNEWSAVTPQHYESGSLRIDLLALLRAWSRLASGRPYGRVVAALIMEGQTDPSFSAEYQRRMVEPRRDQARAIFAAAIGRGEIPAETKVEVAIDLIYGPLYHRLLHGHAPLDDQFVDDIVDMALRGIRTHQDRSLPRRRGLGGLRRRPQFGRPGQPDDLGDEHALGRRGDDRDGLRSGWGPQAELALGVVVDEQLGARRAPGLREPSRRKPVLAGGAVDDLAAPGGDPDGDAAAVLAPNDRSRRASTPVRTRVTFPVLLTTRSSDSGPGRPGWRPPTRAAIEPFGPHALSSRPATLSLTLILSRTRAGPLRDVRTMSSSYA